MCMCMNMMLLVYSDVGRKGGFHAPMPAVWQDVKMSRKEGA